MFNTVDARYNVIILKHYDTIRSPNDLTTFVFNANFRQKQHVRNQFL